MWRTNLQTCRFALRVSGEHGHREAELSEELHEAAQHRVSVLTTPVRDGSGLVWARFLHPFAAIQQVFWAGGPRVKPAYR
jgi:hypothetical protein